MKEILERQKIKNDSRRFEQLITDILSFKSENQAKISKVLGISSSVFSNLYRKVVPAILKSEDEETFINAFTEEGVNNVSKNIITKLPEYIAKLETILLEKQEVSNKINNKPSYATIWQNSIANAIKRTSQRITAVGLLGVYELYTHSTTYPKIIKTSLLIRQNPKDKTIEVLHKGKNEPFAARGIMFLAGSHLITICLIDYPQDIQENTFIHLSLPLLPNPEMLRGVILHIDIPKEPHAARVILRKTGDVISEDDFNSINYQYIEYEDLEIPEIKSYLCDTISNIKCISVPNATHTLNDLPKEKQLIKEQWG